MIAKPSCRQEYARLNIVTLKRELNQLQAQLFAAALAAPPLPKRWTTPSDNHPWRKCGDPTSRLPSLEPNGQPWPSKQPELSRLLPERVDSDTESVRYSPDPGSHPRSQQQ